MLNKTDNSYRGFLCKVLNKHSKWRCFQFNKPNPNLFLWEKFLLDQSSGFMYKFFLVKNMYYLEDWSVQRNNKLLFLFSLLLSFLPKCLSISGHIKQLTNILFPAYQLQGQMLRIVQLNSQECLNGNAWLTCHCFINSLTPLESSRSPSLWVASCRTLAVVSASVSQARNFSRSRGNCCSNLWISSKAASLSFTLQRNKCPDAILKYQNGAPREPREKSKHKGTKLYIPTKGWVVGKISLKSNN